MKTALLILFFYFLFRALRKPTGKRGLSLPGIIEDDSPLPGPWNRPTGRDQDLPLPGPWDRPAETGAGDKPLPGPWDRKREKDTPVETQPAGDTGREHEPAPESPRTKQAPPQKTAPYESVPETRTEHEKPRRYTRDAGSGFDGKQEQPSCLAGDKKEDNGKVDRAAASIQSQSQECKPRKRRENPLEAVLGDKKTLVGGLVLGEVLGSRGGRAVKKNMPFHIKIGRHVALPHQLKKKQ